ncbi:MAG: response regulator [Nitrosopumilus sp.]|uniref:response regulator n=1 Tax=Nitrosopumilus sp. TaxID=2024843 RepID=UPI002430E5B5|nr:response regulator [Nitrosopumilus sp.]MCV0366301.1 response regulator [Nitrosopumilus sp.]
MILFVDDDVDLLGLNAFMLKNLGYDVITAKDGEEAVAKFKEASPSLVIMDIKMPKMDGFDAFFRMKKINPDAKIILISAYAIDEKKLLKAKSQSLLDLISKPYDFDVLENLIKKYV